MFGLQPLLRGAFVMSKNAIDKVYLALDELMQQMPGWSRFILRASEPMFQLLDSIESILEENDSDNRTNAAGATKGNLTGANTINRTSEEEALPS